MSEGGGGGGGGGAVWGLCAGGVVDWQLGVQERQRGKEERAGVK